MNHFVVMALAATLGTWFVTALGAATVVFFTSPNPKSLNMMLGFASGVMIAASFWSLLQPAIQRAEATSSLPAYLVATMGFLLGALFLWASDKIVFFARGKAAIAGGRSNERRHRILMLILSITLHNIPEGLAVGVAFGALQKNGYEPEALMGAVSVAVGIGLLLLSLPCVFGYNIWSDFTPFGEGTAILDLEDFVVSNLLLPIGALIFTLFCVTRYGWGWKNFMAEANTGKGLKVRSWMRWVFTIAIPIIILVIFIMGLVTFDFSR